MCLDDTLEVYYENNENEGRMYLIEVIRQHDFTISVGSLTDLPTETLEKMANTRK